MTCPEYTYQIDGDCVRICPLGYYHYKNGTRGRCSLTHFPDSVEGRGSILKNGSNSFNYSEAFQPCPHLTTNYSYGCYCLKGKSFEFDKWNCNTSKFKVIKIVKAINLLTKDYA